MADIDDILSLGGSSGRSKDGDVTVDMLDYDFIRKCNDLELLKAIVRRLNSKKDGHFEELTEFALSTLIEAMPVKDRTRALAMRSDPSPIDVLNAQESLNNWEKEIKHTKTMTKDSTEGVDSYQHCPPPRNSANGHDKADTKKKSMDTSSELKKGHTDSMDDRKTTERISGYDFKTWEKYDPEKALKDMEKEQSEEELIKQSNKDKSEQQIRDHEERRRQRRQQEIDSVLAHTDVNSMSSMERRVISERERLKGNECVNANEIQQAYTHYTKSIAFLNNMTSEEDIDDVSELRSKAYCNRAMVGMKLEKLEQAEEDCNAALSIDSKYIKAWIRRGGIRHRRGRYALAIKDFNHALSLLGDTDESLRTNLIGLEKKSRDMLLEVEGEDAYRQIEVMESSTNFKRIPILEQEDSEDDVPIAEFKRIPISAVNDSIVDLNQDSENGSQKDPVKGRVKIDSHMNQVNENENIAKSVLSKSSMLASSVTKTDSGFEIEPKLEELLIKSDSFKVQGNALLKSNDLTGALKMYNMALEICPSNAAALSNRCHCYMLLGEWDNAIEDASTVLKSDCVSGSLIAKALYRRGVSSLRKAQVLLTEATQEIPPELHTAIQVLVQQSKRDLDSLVALEPSNSEAVCELQAILASFDEKYTTAKKSDVESGIQHVKEHAHIHFSDGSSPGTEFLEDKIRIKKDIELEKVNPNLAKTHWNRKKEPKETDDVDSSEGQVSDPAQSKNSAEREKNLGNTLLKEGNFEGAVSHYTKGLRYVPGHVDLLNNRSLAKLKLQDYDGCISDASNVLKQNEINLKALTRRGTAYLKLEEFEKSKFDLEKAHKLEPNDATIKKTLEQLNIQISAANQKRDKNRTVKINQESVSEALKSVSVKIPEKSPNNLYEFERVWRDLRNDDASLAAYIRIIKGNVLVKMMDGIVSGNPDLFSKLVTLLGDYVMNVQHDVNESLRVLEAISKAKGLSLAMLMLNENGKQSIGSILDQSESEHPSKVAVLRGKFSM